MSTALSEDDRYGMTRRTDFKNFAHQTQQTRDDFDIMLLELHFNYKFDNKLSLAVSDILYVSVQVSPRHARCAFNWRIARFRQHFFNMTCNRLQQNVYFLVANANDNHTAIQI